jgi:hypothetical protein
MQYQYLNELIDLGEEKATMHHKFKNMKLAGIFY